MKDGGSVGRLAVRRGMIFHPTLGYAIPPPLPPTVARRNARERGRVKTVNQSYEYLRLHVPSASRAKKMSKVDILKHSIEYIQRLRAMVERCDEATTTSSTALPTTPTSPTSSTSGESGYSSPLPLHFSFPPTSHHTPLHPHPSTPEEGDEGRSEEDIILDVILDWQKS